ncbi:sulfotransferase family protein [Bauldia sp.]|uniref:sulfotransferase family protein n=1 Tax=Bauldia sp. TaxID=2575872 RepID=UPI003BABA226
MALVTVIGRGHSGTRAISHTLYASGVYMGRTINASGDLVPPEAMYDACRVMAPYVDRVGELDWDFSRAISADIPAEFTALIERYLDSVLKSSAPERGWKIPETTLVFPWIARLFPDVKYIFWVRDPRDCVLDSHITDDLARFDIDYPPTVDQRRQRAISWKYQYDLMQSTPKPKQWLEVRFEDFVLHQEQTLQRLEDFLGYALARIVVRPEAVGRWKSDTGMHDFDFFEPALRAYGYELSSVAPASNGGAPETSREAR